MDNKSVFHTKDVTLITRDRVLTRAI